MTRAIVILAIAGLLVAGIAYNIQPRQPGRENGKAAAAGLPQVTVAKAMVETTRESVILSGSLKADRQAAVATTMPARILQVLVRNGARVKAGQPVLLLDSRSSDAQIQQSSAGIAAADAALRKAIDGKRARIIELDSQVAQARSGLAIAKSKLSQAELGATLSESSAESDAARATGAVKQAEAGLRQTESALKQANDTLRRVRFLYSKGGVSRAEMEGAESQSEIAKANNDAAESALKQALAAEKPATESRPLRARVSQAEVQSARVGIKQAEDGVKSAVAARAAAIRLADRDIDAARAQVTQAVAGRTQAISASTGRTVTSPAAGIVSDLSVRAGDVAQPGQPLLSVIGDGQLYFEASAPARYAANLRAGTHVSLNFDTGTKVNGTIRRVLPLTQDGRTIPVEIALPNPPRGLVAGASGRAEIHLARSPAISIPTVALRADEGKQYVLVSSNGAAERRAIVVGDTRDDKTEIRSGLASGESVIVSGPADLKPGDRIETAHP